jgi:hypothetical protein
VVILGRERGRTDRHVFVLSPIASQSLVEGFAIISHLEICTNCTREGGVE